MNKIFKKKEREREEERKEGGRKERRRKEQTERKKFALGLRCKPSPAASSYNLDAQI